MSESLLRAGVLSQWAPKRYPDKVAVKFKDRRITYGELDDEANRFANALIGLGLKPSDRVAVMLPNSIESFTVPLAMERAGLVYVRLNSAESLEEWGYILEDSGSVGVILDAAFVAKWKDSGIRDDREILEIAVRSTKVEGVRSYENLICEAHADPPEILVGHEAIIAIGYTSGTTGRPKGVIMTHGQRLNRLRNDLLNQDLIIDHNDVLLSVAPLTHAAGVYARTYTLRGATNVIMDKFDAGAVLETIERERVTAILLVPTMMFRLVNHPEAGGFDLSSLRRVYYGTAPIALEVLQKFIQLVGPGVLRQQYGATEHPQPIAFLQPEDHCLDGDETSRKRLRSVGRVALGVELRLVGGDGKEVEPGDAGEIQIRSDAGMKGYWNNPEETGKTIVDGWLRTGDIGEMDEDGYLYIVDRSKDMILTGGFNVYPREVERVIESHPDVLEVCVFGVPDEEWGESVKAVIRLRPETNTSEADIVAHCREHLASYKKPKTVDFVDQLPKNANGKVLKRVLRDPYWANEERKI